VRRVRDRDADCGGTPKDQLTSPLADLSSYPSLLISDASGGEQTLYYDVSFKAPQDQLSYSVPPLPAGGCFDSRFAGDFRAVQGGGGTIQIQSSSFPITVTAQNVPVLADDQYILVEVVEGKEGTRHELSGGVPIEIQNTKVKTLLLQKESAVPLVFALEQNYPNPFNPKTVISFQLPEVSSVKLVVYDLLAERWGCCE